MEISDGIKPSDGLRHGWWYASSPEVGWLYYPEPTYNIAHWAIGFTRDMKQLRIYEGTGYRDMVVTMEVPHTLRTVEEKKAWAIGVWRTYD